MSSYGRVIMPFGQHKGEYLADIPMSYLLWCVDGRHVVIQHPELEEAMRKVIEMKERSGE